MINEKEMEEAIIRNPAKYIGEEGLRLVGRQFSIGGYRFDLLFEDRHGGKLIVELQRGILDRSHMFKILDYCDEFRDRNPAEFVEPMVIANIIPPERKRRLSHSGIPFREIPEIEFTGGMISKTENPDANAPGPREPSPNEFTHGGITPMTGSPTDAPAILSWEAAGLSLGQIDDLKRAIQSFITFVLPGKKEREAEAEEILRLSKGKYTIKILNEVFDRVDKGPIGPVPGDWFGETLSKPNRNRLGDCPIEELRELIDKLRETGDLGCLGEWRRANKRNRGMKTGAATLLMYLHSPECYNVWLPKTHSGLSWLCRLGAKIPKGEMSPEKYRTFYKEFNEKAIAVRETNGFDPQTMDWFLFAVDEIKTNRVDRGLRALIEAERSNADRRDPL